MKTVPLIFTVFVWRLEGMGRRLDMHYVAGLDSADAEERIKASHASHLAGQCFITTDEHEAERGDSSKLYASSWRNEESVPDADYRHWMRSSTRASRVDGDLVPAIFRRFHVDNNRTHLAARARAAQLAS